MGPSESGRPGNSEIVRVTNLQNALLYADQTDHSIRIAAGVTVPGSGKNQA